MRQIRMFRALVLVAALYVAAGWVLAYNPGAHIYIAESAYPGVFDRIDLRYGAISPDIAWFVPNPQNWPTAGQDTHVAFIELEPAGWSRAQKAFAKGWTTHNEVYGADNVAHIQWNNQQPGYVVQKAMILASQIGSPVTVDLAHTVVEAAVDLLVQEHLDSRIAQKVLYAVLLRSLQDKALLDETFVWDAHRTNWWTLTQSEIEFRTITYQYAQALAQSNTSSFAPLVDFAKQLASQLYGIDITSAQGQQILSAALALCSGDFDDAIQDAINQLQAH
jgi:hypothetical protein